MNWSLRVEWARWGAILAWLSLTPDGISPSLTKIHDSLGCILLQQPTSQALLIYQRIFIFGTFAGTKKNHGSEKRISRRGHLCTVTGTVSHVRTGSWQTSQPSTRSRQTTGARWVQKWISQRRRGHQRDCWVVNWERPGVKIQSWSRLTSRVVVNSIKTAVLQSRKRFPLLRRWIVSGACVNGACPTRGTCAVIHNPCSALVSLPRL